MNNEWIKINSNHAPKQSDTENTKQMECDLAGSVTTVVFAYGGAKETVRRHLPIWKAHTDDLLLVSPSDAPCVIDGVNCLTFSKSQRYGPHSLERQLFGMKAALGYDSDFYVFLEYDAIMLQRPRARPIVQGNLFNQHLFYNNDDRVWQGVCFMHYPWVFPADKLKNFVNTVELSVFPAHQFRDSNDGQYERTYCQDVWMVQKLLTHGFEIHNLSGYDSREIEIGEGFSRHTIDKNNIELALLKARNGAYALHGIKDEETLSQILQASNKKKN